MTDRMPKAAMEYFADCTGMYLTYSTKNGLQGEAKMRVPMTDSMRLVCPLKIVASTYRKAVAKAAIVLHVRQDMYLLIVYDCTTKGAAMLALNGTEVEHSMKDLFKRAMDMHAVYKRCADGVVRIWGMQRGGTWIPQNDNCLV